MLGKTYYQLGQISDAISHYRSAEVLYTQLGNTQWVQYTRDQLRALV